MFLFSKNIRLLTPCRFWRPTWQGLIILILFPLILLYCSRYWIHDFLAVTDPVDNPELSITEGWLADPLITEVINHLGGTDTEIYTTGGPLERGSALLEFGTYAEMTEKRFETRGYPVHLAISAPSDEAFKHRTYHAAIAARDKLIADKGKKPKSINVFTESTHARRTRMLFQKAFGKDTQVGIIALPPMDYDPKRWWSVSGGAKGTIMEWIACTHEWLLDSGR